MNEAGLIVAAAPSVPDEDADYVVVGQVSGLFGTRGWLKVFSYTRPRDNLLRYNPWYLRGAQGWERFEVGAGRTQRGGIVARLVGVDDRDRAALLMRRDIAVLRAELAPLPAGEHYWAELIGMRVRNLDGAELGAVRALFETGAHDVLEVVGATTHLIPYVRAVYVIAVDPAARMITVDWHVDD